jgi:hypothetical protein
MSDDMYRYWSRVGLWTLTRTLETKEATMINFVTFDLRFHYGKFGELLGGSRPSVGPPPPIAISSLVPVKR